MSSSWPPYRKQLSIPLGLSLLVVIAGLAHPGEARSQDRAHLDAEALLRGVVTAESTSSPIASATISLIGQDLATRSAEDGSFSFPRARPGAVSIRVEAAGYATIVEEIQIPSGAITFVELVLPSMGAVLEELFVTGRRGAETGQGDAGTAADLLARRVFGAHPGVGMVGQANRAIPLRGISSLTQSGEPAVLIDGVRVAGGVGVALETLSRIPASDVKAIHILRGPATAFLHSYAAGGVILVETRRGPDT